MRSWRCAGSPTDAPLWLSAVVVEELLCAGTADRDRQVLERLERDFDRAKRILIPNLSDWTQAGRVLARFAARGHRGGARHCRAAGGLAGVTPQGALAAFGDPLYLVMHFL